MHSLADENTDSKAANSKSKEVIRPTKSANEPGKPRVLPDQAALHKQMTDMVLQFTKRSSYRGGGGSVTKSQLFNPRGSTQDLNAAATYPARLASSRGKQSHDVLDSRGHKFTTPDQPFQPRINKRSSSRSKLATTESTYQAPRSRATSARNSVVSTSRVDENNINDNSEFMKANLSSSSRQKSPNKSASRTVRDEDDLSDQDDDDNENEFVSKYKDKMNRSALNESSNMNVNTSRASIRSRTQQATPPVENK
jgi:hypothetical protein